MKRDREDAVLHEADALAGDRFDQLPEDVWQWLTEVGHEEYGDQPFKALQQVIWAAHRLATYRNDPEAAGKVVRAIGNLRNEYIDHASARGLFYREAEDLINCAAADQAEQQRDLEAEWAGLRG